MYYIYELWEALIAYSVILSEVFWLLYSYMDLLPHLNEKVIGGTPTQPNIISSQPF